MKSAFGVSVSAHSLCLGRMPHMRLLVLGGTRFLGRAVVDEAVRRGYDVTTFSRGNSGEPRLGAEALHGDRTSPIAVPELAKPAWDPLIHPPRLPPVPLRAPAPALA